MGSIRLLITATLAALLTLISAIDTAAPDTCSVALSLESSQRTLKGMAVGVKKAPHAPAAKR